MNILDAEGVQLNIGDDVVVCYPYYGSYMTMWQGTIVKMDNASIDVISNNKRNGKLTEKHFRVSPNSPEGIKKTKRILKIRR